jgi:uncharacterized membrane protein
MTILEKSIMINATPEAIEAISLDTPRVPEWYAGVESISPDGTYPQPGGKADVVYKSGGVTFKMKMTVTELEPGQSFAQSMEGMIAGNYRTTYEGQGAATKVTMRFDYEMPGAALGKVLDKLVVERMNAKNLDSSLSKLKELVESN